MQQPFGSELAHCQINIKPNIMAKCNIKATVVNPLKACHQTFAKEGDEVTITNITTLPSGVCVIARLKDGNRYGWTDINNFEFD